MNEITKALQQSIDNGEFSSFLMGKKKPALPDPWIESPIDIARVFIQGCNPYAQLKKENQARLTEEFHRAFLELLKSASGTWWTIAIIYSYLFGFLENKLLFKINVDVIIPEINRSLNTFEQDLRSSKEWVGWRFPGGLWEDVVQMANRINSQIAQNKTKILV